MTPTAITSDGTRRLALELLHANGVNESNSRLLAQGSVAVAERLQKGQLDAALVVGTPTAALVWQVLATPKSLAELIDHVCAEYDVEPRAAQDDLIPLLESMLEAAVIQEVA